MAYDFIDQNIVASCLIQSHTDDSFYNPVANSHTGYAFDGNYYSQGVIQAGIQQASWFTEYGTNVYRGDKAAFPTYGLVLLSPVSLVILDQTISVSVASALPLWMQFILADNNALANNFNGAVQGFLPASVCYADGVISVTYTPDAGNEAEGIPTLPATFWSPSNNIPPAEIPSTYPVVPAQSRMVVSIDFVRDFVYLDVAVGPQIPPLA
jgi:hypothetical protein